MGKAPMQCPICGNRESWKLVDKSNKGFSVGKAAVGAVLLGPIGLVGGALGKKNHRRGVRTFIRSIRPAFCRASRTSPAFSWRLNWSRALWRRRSWAPRAT